MAALLLANLAVLGMGEKTKEMPAAEYLPEEELAQEVLSENTMEEAYPNLYAQGEIRKETLPEKVVFLTFDDGPSRNTVKILDTLKKYNAKATFFLIGENLTEDGVKIAKRALEEGHMLGMHTETHQYEKIYRSVDSFLSDYDKLASRFVEVFGECPAVFRFPGGSYSSYINPIRRSLQQELERRGFLGYDWDVSGEDSVGTPTAESIMENIFRDIGKREAPIVLLHDSPSSNLTAEVLPKILERLSEEGYTFMTLEHREPYQFPW